MDKFFEIIFSIYPMILMLGAAGVAVGILEYKEKRRKAAQQAEEHKKAKLTAGKQPRCEFEQLYNHLLIQEIMESNRSAELWEK